MFVIRKFVIRKSVVQKFNVEPKSLLANGREHQLYLLEYQCWVVSMRSKPYLYKNTPGALLYLVNKLWENDLISINNLGH
jgi:hypothetical protein